MEQTMNTLRPGARHLAYVGVAILTWLVSYSGLSALGVTQSGSRALPPAAASRLGQSPSPGSPFFVPSPLIALAVPRHPSELGKGGRGVHRQEAAGDTQGEIVNPGTTPLPPPADADGRADAAQQEPLLAPFTDGRDGQPPPSALATGSRADSAWPWPTLGTISTEFSVAHPGLDIAAPFGTGVQAVAPGVVIDAQKRNWGLGWFLVLDHGDGVTSTYAHLGGFLVKAGEPIGQGQPIGWVGSTGFSTGPHLHFELHRDGRPLDPLGYLAVESAPLRAG